RRPTAATIRERASSTPRPRSPIRCKPRTTSTRRTFAPRLLRAFAGRSREALRWGEGWDGRRPGHLAGIGGGAPDDPLAGAGVLPEERVAEAGAAAARRAAAGRGAGPATARAWAGAAGAAGARARAA